MTATSTAPAALDLGFYVHPEDTILWGQGAGEPLTLVETLVNERTAIGPVNVFVGASYSGILKPEHSDYIRMIGIGGIGTNAALARSGALDVLPCHVSTIASLISSGRIPVDVVLLHVSEANGEGVHSLGLVAEWMRAAIESARVVLAEVNDRMPFTRGDTLVHSVDIDAMIHVSREPVTVVTPTPSEEEEALAEWVSSLVGDRFTVQLGVGSVAPAVARALHGKRDLGLHCGTVGDWFIDLNESGALTNRFKGVDVGTSVAASILGSRALYDYVADNPAIELRPFSYTHDPRLLAGLPDLVAINSAIEIDLTGQTNAETVGGSHVGAVGGQVDFVRAAMLSGRSIIALPSTARRGQVSRIVPRLADGVVTTPRSDADFVVTEHGVADLRGAPLRERAFKLIAIADPAYRDWLTEHLVGGPPPC